MARYSAGVRTGAGSTTLPIISIYSSASVAPKVREIGVFNTTTTAVALKLVKLTATGTQGAGQTETAHDSDAPAASATVFTTHTVTAANTDAGYRATLGAAAGSGVIWTFGDTGLRPDVGTANGIGVIVSTGTGQVCDAYIVWDE